MGKNNWKTGEVIGLWGCFCKTGKLETLFPHQLSQSILFRFRRQENYFEKLHRSQMGRELGTRATTSKAKNLIENLIPTGTEDADQHNLFNPFFRTSICYLGP